MATTTKRKPKGRLRSARIRVAYRMLPRDTRATLLRAMMTQIEADLAVVMRHEGAEWN